MDWSFDLLTDPERAVLPRLSVFAGSFSLEAAETVVSDDAVPGDDVLDLLGHLVDRSLLVAEDGGIEARYRMLETIRDYAQERLAESGEAVSRYTRHRDWFAALVDEARPAFFSGRVQPEWVARLAADHDNLRAALRWAHEDPAGANVELGMASGLWRFWEVRGDLEEGSAWLERALDRLGGEVSLRRASALTGAGVLAAHRGDYARAAAFHDASLMLHRELGDPVAIATACNNAASVAIERSDFQRARELYAEAIELTGGAGDRARRRLHGHQPGGPHLAGWATRGRRIACSASSIAMFEDLGDQWGAAHASTPAGPRRPTQRRLENARIGFEEALPPIAARATATGRRGCWPISATSPPTAGDIARAEALYQQSLAVRSELGDRIGMAAVLERLAGVAEDRPRRAAALDRRRPTLSARKSARRCPPRASRASTSSWPACTDSIGADGGAGRRWRKAARRRSVRRSRGPPGARASCPP